MANTQGRQKTPPVENLIGRTLCHGEYAIQKVLGHGGMGKVFLASHDVLAVPLALKQLKADEPLPESAITELDYILQGGDASHIAAERRKLDCDFPSSGGSHTDRFLREALLLARLQHPAIPSLYDYFYEDGSWYLVMDYVPGPTLSAYLREHSPLPALEALNYAMQLCDVLDYLHKQTPPIVFRDLKPPNVILTPDGALMLVDFGIARYFKSGQVNDTTDFGSPGYAPPEQYQGQGQTDGRSDLYSLGVMLQEMVSGKRASEVLPYPNLPGKPAISSALAGLIALATRPEPARRFQTAHTFYLALERTYMVEEKRAYRQRVQKVKELAQARTGSHERMSPKKQETGRHAEPGSIVRNGPITPRIPPSPIENDMPVLPLLSLNLEQRRQTRETLQRARRDRMEQENLELELASVDESLKMRSAMTFAQSPVTLEDDFVEVHWPQRSKRRTRQVIQVGFLLILLLSLVIASLLAYANIVRMPRMALSGDHTPFPTRSATSTTTSPPTASATSAVNASASLTGSWQQLPSLPSPEADNAAIYSQVQGRDYIYMNGGYRGSSRQPYYDRGLYRYDIAAAQWQVVVSNGFPGMLNNVVVQDEQGQLIFSAGYSTDTYTVPSLLYLYTPTKGSVRKITPPPQVHLGFGGSMIADQQGHVYITQGFMQSGNPQALAGTGWYRYDLVSDQWHLLASLPIGLGYVSLAADGAGGILLLGGSLDEGQQMQENTVYRYDIASDDWLQQTKTTPTPLSGAASCLVGPDQLAIVGGYDAAHFQGLSMVWLVNLHNLSWTKLPSLPSGGSVLGSAGCDESGHIFLIQGASNPHRPVPDFWELTLNHLPTS